ncbi:MAG: hypothetical protein FJW30_04120 [Acidobacteria bacterium]|nr:hypothetical protein [Acidobacteriota bacterium]
MYRSMLLLGCLLAWPGQAQVPIEAGRVSDGQPSGLFYRVEVAMTGARRVDTKTWLFLPGNRVGRVYPFGGTGALDTSRCNPDTCGYRETGGGKLTVRWDGGRVDQWTFATAGGNIILDNVEFRPARPVAASALVGRWSSAGEGGSNVYQFDGNGRFRFGAGGSSSGLTGTYRVDGFVLTLSFPDGDVRRRTLFGASAGEALGMISVDRDVFAKQ